MPFNSNGNWDGYDVKMGPLSEEEAEILRNIVSRIGSCADFGGEMETICDIVDEEMGAFAAGDKTAEIIRNRAVVCE